jgi:hypothetical protein
VNVSSAPFGRLFPALGLALGLIGFRPALADGRAPLPDEAADVPPAPRPAAVGEWIDGGSLRFRVDAVKRCGAGAASRPGESRQASTLVAFAVRIVAGRGEIFVSPRDVTLESGGVILQTENSSTTQQRPQCAPTLSPRRLPARQTASAVVLFEISPEFQAGQGPIILAYRPTRWGGSRRLEVEIPTCLDRCAKHQ